MHFVVTSDGGRRFTVVRFPKGESIQTVSCPTAAHCVAVGLYDNNDPRTGPDVDHGILLTSDDGGLTWQHHAWPNGYGPGPSPGVTCADASHCAMIGWLSATAGRAIGGYSSGKDAVQYTVIAFSSDGGVTWTASTLPHTMPYPMMDALACRTSQTCYAARGDLIAQRIGNTYNAESSVVAVTPDAGRTWQRVSFAVPAKVPGGMQGDSFMQIGQIQCPSPDACVAIGGSDRDRRPRRSTPTTAEGPGTLGFLRQAARTRRPTPARPRSGARSCQGVIVMVCAARSGRRRSR